MHKQAYYTGYLQAVQDLGIEKQAFLRYAPAVGKRLKGFFSSILGKTPGAVRKTERVVDIHGIPRQAPAGGLLSRKNLWGEPGRFIDEIRTGKAFKPEGLIASNLEDYKDPLGMGLGVGLPAAFIGSTAMSDDPNKGKAIAGDLAGLALGATLFRPLGLLGSFGGYELGRRATDKITGHNPAPPQLPTYGNNLAQY